MKKWTRALLMLFLLGMATAQQRNSSGLLPEEDFVGPVSNAIYPYSIFLADTGVVVRYVLLLVICGWDTFVVCDPAKRALNFFGQEERLPEDVCSSPDTQGELIAYTLVRATENEFPEPAQLYAQIMQDNGYDPEDRSTDASMAIGMGNIIGTRVAEWMRNDGWNSRGDLTRKRFRKPFEDYTGYVPVNSPYELKYPLRWQPLIDADSKFGRFTVQEHVVPFAGYARPLLLSHEEFAARYVEFPYLDMNTTELSENTTKEMDIVVRQVMQASVDSTPRERALAKWFDNKFISIGVFGAGYSKLLGFDRGFSSRWNLGELLAQYDASSASRFLVVWKEKRRIDAVRPKSIVRSLYADEDFQVFVSPDLGVTTVKGKDWEPLVATQPHSEFPSASAAICTAFADHGHMMLQEYMNAKGMSEEPEITLAAWIAAGEGINGFTFDSIKEAGRLCGMSRVWAGVHFPPAVPAGEKLAERIGARAYEFARQLSEGKVPDGCWWCKS